MISSFRWSMVDRIILLSFPIPPLRFLHPNLWNLSMVHNMACYSWVVAGVKVTDFKLGTLSWIIQMNPL